MTEPEKSTAQLAYEAWADSYVGLSKAVPWAELETAEQNAWHAAVNAVQRAHYGTPGE